MRKTCRTAAVRSFFHLFVVAALLFAGPGLAQKLVDPNTVSPEFREAAEKRRAEQLRTMQCHHKAEDAKVLPRDRAAHINRCLEEAAGK